MDAINQIVEHRIIVVTKKKTFHPSIENQIPVERANESCSPYVR